ncbi:MAG: DUF4339 domain-containing protein [Muribaculaceae bacterium]|nr:DUF4339 domain-containing protein [Muribaculaceae bacterium]MBR0024245.1 DUF4339 domain-containing protein [Muribaculaceae bacterium]
MKQFYFLKDDQQLGPFPVDQLLQNGLEPSMQVWAEDMSEWVAADQVPELQELFESEQTVAERQPEAPHVAPAVEPQRRYNTAPREDAQMNSTQQNVFKIILYVLLGLTVLGGVSAFFGAFRYFRGWFSRPMLGMVSILNAAAVIAIGVISIIRMARNEKFGFLTIGYYVLALLLSMVSFLISRVLGVGILTVFLCVAGLLVSILASIPSSRIGDVNSYKNLLKEAVPFDFVLLGVFVVANIFTMIWLLSFLKRLNSIVV